MAFFKDLTPYTYHRKNLVPNGLNVGWLSEGEPFPKGNVDSKLLDKLDELVLNPMHLMRGVHHCEFCPPPIYRRVEGKCASELVRDSPKGNGEIWVEGPGEVVFVAPVLITHYIHEHQYLPPRQFLDAVRAIL